MDSERDNRSVETKIYYPDSFEDGPYPVVMVSHSLSGSNEANTYFAEHLTSHGYVVVSAEHEGSNNVAKDAAFNQRLHEYVVGEGFSSQVADRFVSEITQEIATFKENNPGDLRAMQEALEGGVFGQRFVQAGFATDEQIEAALLAAHEASTDDLYRNPDEWADRPQDISFLLDQLEHAAARNPELSNLVDLNNVAAAGHSYGAYTSIALAGAGVAIPGQEGLTSFADDRIDAVFVMSPQGTGDDFAFRQDSFGMMMPDVPLFIMAGENEIDRDGQPGWRREPFILGSSNEKYFVEVNSRHHQAFGNNGDTSTHEFVEGFGLTFLDSELKQSPVDTRTLNSFKTGETNLGSVQQGVTINSEFDERPI